MKENKRFTAPEVKVIRFTAKDIIATSGPEEYGDEQYNEIPGEDIELGGGTQ